MTAANIAIIEGIIVANILSDLTNRRGLRQAWDKVDEDIRFEIVQTWKEIVRDTLTQNR